MEETIFIEGVIQSYLVDAPLLVLVFYMVWKRDQHIKTLMDILRELAEEKLLPR